VTSRELEESTSLDQIFTFPLSGIILMNSLDDKIYSYIRAHVPAIVGVDTSHKEIDNIEYDHYLASSLAVDTFYAKGYRDIGFIGAAPDELGLENSRRFKGYFSSMHAHGLTIRKETCVNCHWQEKECYEIIQKLFHEHALPEAFLVASDLMAMAVLRTLFDLGIQVPEQIAVMGITNIEMSRFSNPPLTTIDIPASHMGTLAFDTLLQRIQGYDMLPRRISLPLNVLLRSSI
jgi:DNA-binding LacI/PurR family transcriptional regulator